MLELSLDAELLLVLKLCELISELLLELVLIDDELDEDTELAELELTELVLMLLELELLVLCELELLVLMLLELLS